MVTPELEKSQTTICQVAVSSPTMEVTTAPLLQVTSVKTQVEAASETCRGRAAVDPVQKLRSTTGGCMVKQANTSHILLKVIFNGI